jgi:hypothetical protein
MALPLAKGIGYNDGEEFLEALRNYRERVRMVYDKILMMKL